ncbi:MAG: glycoside hydrolase family 127 protein [Chthonomonadales bacterium]|nr:glycoside hydrolase family 127 protein [Chthonomonadales bacterium]
MIYPFIIALPVAATSVASVGRSADLPQRPLQQGSHWRFRGELGRRIKANTDGWLLRAPTANPGLLDMFRRRDRRQAYPAHTPWAGEFAGKYLISAVQACRITEDRGLRKSVEGFVRDLIATQDSDGYLGPWPKERRLVGDCDLWGHYHCMEGLLLWADEMHDKKALAAVYRAAERICALYVDGDRRPIEAGNPCFNLSALHIFAELYRRDGNARWLTLIRRIEEDMEKDGDWLRGGIKGTPYWQLPGSGPRWEALHILQGFLTLWRAIGDDRYRTAVLNHWHSIRDLDRHPSGAFSTNEQAMGTVFQKGAIETCCSVAWMALTTDILQITDDPTVADELELTLWNQALAAQHPSGNWCTYDTPLDGIRAPSYQQISFQYRPGTPELNCCSVNSPRTLGMLADWAFLQHREGLTVNFYGPGKVKARLDGGGTVTITERTDYPVSGRVHVEVDAGGKEVEIRFRIPAWSRDTTVRVNGKALPVAVRPGAYLPIRRTWTRGDAVELTFDMTPRLTLGEGPDRGGAAAIHSGPILLTLDAGLNTFETPDTPPIDVRNVRLVPLGARVAREAARDWTYPPMGIWRMQADHGREMLVCDFASAGSRGTDYRAWLPIRYAPPAPPQLQIPRSDARGTPGSILFRWSGSGAADDRFILRVARDAAMKEIVYERADLTEPHMTVDAALSAPGDYYWSVTAVNDHGRAEPREAPRRLTVTGDAPNAFLVVREDGCMAASPLDGSAAAAHGVVTFEEGIRPSDDRRGVPNSAISCTGAGSGIHYLIPYFPTTDYSVAVWVRPGPPQPGMTQIFSAWCRAGDDPLRVTMEHGRVSARIEAGGFYRTTDLELEQDKWVHIAAVKRGERLSLYVAGREVAACDVPREVRTLADQIGLGCNPLYAGGERFVGAMDDFSFYGRALTPDEIKGLATTD